MFNLFELGPRSLYSTESLINLRFSRLHFRENEDKTVAAHDSQNDRNEKTA
jgi:hypothetical protein